MARAKAAARSNEADEASTSTSVLAGVLQRIGDVLGPGAAFSLVRFGAAEEGVRLAAHVADTGTAAVIQHVATILGLEVRIAPGKKAIGTVRITSSPEFNLESQALVALVVGLLEGILTTTTHSKVQVKGTPRLTGNGKLVLEFSG